MSKLNWKKVGQANTSFRRDRQWEEEERDRERRRLALAEYEKQRLIEEQSIQPKQKKTRRRKGGSFQELLKRFTSG